MKTIRTAELVPLARGGPAAGHRHGLEFVGPLDPGRDRAQVLRPGRQLRRRGAGSLAPQDGRTDRRRSRTAVVAVGWNSERFDGRNLALRLAALGYTRVYWYRGGREAWEVAELPETELALREW